MGRSVIGNTTDFDSVIPSSSLGAPTSTMCEVCGDANVFTMTGSMFVDRKFSSCRECFYVRAEPFDLIVLMSSDEVAEWAEEIISATLKRTGKTRGEYEETVEAVRRAAMGGI